MQRGDEAMKQGHEALNALSLQLLKSVKRFIAKNLYSVLNASSPLFLTENRRLTLHRCYL
jgi:hypothetical protein